MVDVLPSVTFLKYYSESIESNGSSVVNKEEDDGNETDTSNEEGSVVSQRNSTTMANGK